LTGEKILQLLKNEIENSFKGRKLGAGRWRI
jgi:hypothetical protein